MSNKKVAFNDSPDVGDDVEYNKNIKINGKQPRFKSSKAVSEEQFKEKIREHQEGNKELMGKIWELSNKYTSSIKDKTLSENKSPLQKEIETDIAKQLTNIALDLNNDEQQPEGVGSIGLLMLLLKTNLIQRNIINDLGYKVHKLEQSLDSFLSRESDE